MDNNIQRRFELLELITIFCTNVIYLFEYYIKIMLVFTVQSLERFLRFEESLHVKLIYVCNRGFMLYITLAHKMLHQLGTIITESSY